MGDSCLVFDYQARSLEEASLYLAKDVTFGYILSMWDTVWWT